VILTGVLTALAPASNSRKAATALCIAWSRGAWSRSGSRSSVVCALDNSASALRIAYRFRKVGGSGAHGREFSAGILMARALSIAASDPRV
jgi:hypothetical protein